MASGAATPPSPIAFYRGKGKKMEPRWWLLKDAHIWGSLGYLPHLSFPSGVLGGRLIIEQVEVNWGTTGEQLCRGISNGPCVH